MEKIRNLSLKKTIVLYIVISLIVSYLSAALIIQIADRTQEAIWWKYIDEEKYFKARENEGEEYIAAIPRPVRYMMSDTDVKISEFCDFLQTYSTLMISVAGVIAAVALFYRNKIKVPLAEMTFASRMIAENELDFQMNYKCGDELGRLCMEFEKMRAELEKNSRRMWRMVEEEKALRAAIAHDIRTPMAVLQGYQEMLLEFVPEDAIDKEKIIEILQEGMGQIERLNAFIETTRKMSSLEEREIQYTKTSLNALAQRIEKSGEAVLRASDKAAVVEVCILSAAADGQSFLADSDVILEVAENLLSNAVRYARERVMVTLALSGTELAVTVTDDGSGFTESAEKVTKAFYHANPQDDLNHSGLGMYISRLYCEKHGGMLLTGNRGNGGAVVKAVYKVKKETAV